MNYRIYKAPNKEGINDKDTLRVDLFDNFKIKDIKELQDFNIIYITKGHEDKANIKGKLVSRKVRYIQVFKKKIS